MDRFNDNDNDIGRDTNAEVNQRLVLVNLSHVQYGTYDETKKMVCFVDEEVVI